MILGTGEYTNKFISRLSLLRTRDYVVTSSYVYKRYYDENAIRGMEGIAEDAQKYYVALEKQNLVATFEGKGPDI